MSGMTRWRIGLGPVFVYEWITSSRRWQSYARPVVFRGGLAWCAHCRSLQHQLRLPLRRFVGWPRWLSCSSWLFQARSLRSFCLLPPRRRRGRSASIVHAWNALAHADDRSFGWRDRAGQAGSAAGSGAGAAGVFVAGDGTARAPGRCRPGGAPGRLSRSRWVLPCSGVAWRCSFRCGWARPTKRSWAPTQSGRCGCWPGRCSTWWRAGSARSGANPLQTADPFFLALAPYWWPSSVTGSDYLWFLGVTVSLSVHPGRDHGAAAAVGLPA